jgi:hypothetical protein
MNKYHKSHLWALIFVFVFLVFAIPAPAQIVGGNPCVSDTDRSPFPFDFSDKYYLYNGVNTKEIIGRRNGTDGLSVINRTCDPNKAPVRVLATLPAYDLNGNLLYWTPLGDIQYAGFTPDKRGLAARTVAEQYPMYIFPDNKIIDPGPLPMMRHAPIITAAPGSAYDPNPLGLRVMLVVNYTEKAFTKYAYEIMTFFAKKNGLAVDDTPILKSVDDIRFMLKNEFITIEPYFSSTAGPMAKHQYAISPVLVRKDGIAPDAFLWMTKKYGEPLPTEAIFMRQFECMKKIGDWCKIEEAEPAFVD